MDIAQDFQSVLSVQLNGLQIIKNLSVALICGLFISLCYRWTNKRLGQTRVFSHSLIFLGIITAIVIMVIENNLARAFGLVGAMSIIRFRTAVKDIYDILFIFFALGIGMAAGARMHLIAFTGTAFVIIVMLLLTRGRELLSSQREYLLTFSFRRGDADEDLPYSAVFNEYCRAHHLVNIKSLGEDNFLEMSFYIVLKNSDQAAQFLLALEAIDRVENVNFFYDEGYD